MFEFIIVFRAITFAQNIVNGGKPLRLLIATVAVHCSFLFCRFLFFIFLNSLKTTLSDRV